MAESFQRCMFRQSCSSAPRIGTRNKSKCRFGDLCLVRWTRMALANEGVLRISNLSHYLESIQAK